MMQIWSERTSRHPGELKEPDAAMCVRTRFASWGSSLRFQFEALSLDLLLGNLIVEILTLELGKLSGE